MGMTLYDTTLRDGAQREGISFSLGDKLRIAQKLDDLGVRYIEGGWPASNPKDMAFFNAARELELSTAVITAVGSTRRPGADVAMDRNVASLIDAGTQVVTVVGKAWDQQVLQVLGTTLDENLSMIADSVEHLRSLGKKVIFDAEHFFDGYGSDPAYAMRTLASAAEAGAAVLVLCDTNGGALTSDVTKIAGRVKHEISVPLGIHAHNDAGMAEANSIAAVQAGATHVQGTINGYGERCGNADLCAIIPTLELKLGLECIGRERLRSLTEVAHYVDEIANLTPYPYQPYVGRSAFGHKGGLHVNALLKWADSYQHIDPADVGNRQRVIVSELSGSSNILYKAQEYELGEGVSREQSREALDRIKELESRGFQFEGAEASVELLLRRMQASYAPPFELLGFHVLVESPGGREVTAQATVKLRVGEEIEHTAAEGDGPVNALDIAARKALLPFYPEMADSHLVDYKVRILDSRDGTAAQVRVLIDSAAGGRRWSTVGCSSNIIEASWQALADSLEYALIGSDGASK